MTDSAVVARRNMVESQIRPNKVTDLRVIDAFAEVPRERFVPSALAGVAYVDEDLELAPGRFLMEPMVLARLIQALDLRPTDKVLEIGAGTGYGAAITARLAGSVVALEEDPTLHAAGRQALAALPAGRVTAVLGPLAAGHPPGQPYDAILISGAVEVIPPVILDQLAEGGRLATVRLLGGLGEASLYLRRQGVMSHRGLFEAGTPRLPGFAAPPRFVF